MLDFFSFIIPHNIHYVVKRTGREKTDYVRTGCARANRARTEYLKKNCAGAGRMKTSRAGAVCIKADRARINSAFIFCLTDRLLQRRRYGSSRRFLTEERRKMDE